MAVPEGKREKDRSERRKQVGSNVRAWPVGLQTHCARMREIADREFSFERFYAEVQRFAGSAVTRELLKEFMLAEGIELKKRPKARGRLA